MQKVVRTGIRLLLFVLLTVLVICAINNTVTAKWMLDVYRPMTEEFRGFYSLERNTMDVLVLGSSHAGAGVSPQELYNARHLRAYNLSSDSQSVFLSYYWLKEALQYQQPSVVIFDCYYLFNPEENEENYRKAMDWMKWGPVKREAVHEIVENDHKQDVLSYRFPFMRYHTRWSEPEENDFIWLSNDHPDYFLGGYIYLNTAEYEGYQPFKENASEGKELIPWRCRQYFEKLISLCESNNIKLVLVKTPTHLFSQKLHNTISSIADQYNIPFFDFNTEDLYQEIGFIYDSGDMSDTKANATHTNLSGARKISRFLADVIVENGWAAGHTDEKWETSRSFYDGLYKDFELHNTTDLPAYLKLLKDDRYTVFLTTKEGVGALPEDAKKRLTELGCTINLSDSERQNMQLLSEQGIVRFEELSEKPEEIRDSFRSGIMRLVMESGGKSSVKINEQEQSKNLKGLNIVVYSNDRNCVIDSVNFDTLDKEYTCNR